MDYMQEVGSRQKKALTALLLGRGEESTEKLQRAEEARKSRLDTERAAYDSNRNDDALSVREQAADGTETVDAEVRTSGFRREDADKQAASQTQAEEFDLLRPAETDGMDHSGSGGRQQNQLERQAEEYILYRGADAVWREENADRAQQRGSGFRTSVTADSWDAAAMSRIFQRDARRYDGSFRTD